MDNTADRIDEYTYSYDPSQGAGGKAPLYLEFLQATVLPFAQVLLHLQKSTCSSYLFSTYSASLGRNPRSASWVSLHSSPVYPWPDHEPSTQAAASVDW